MFAEFAEPAMVLDPVVTVVMRLLAPPAMADDRITQTERTPARDRFRITRREVETRLAIIRRKWDKDNRTAGRLSLSRIFDGWCPEESLPPSCLISGQEGYSALSVLGYRGLAG